MKICFVVNDFPLLSETFVLSQMTGLQKRGFDVSVRCDRIAPSKGIDIQADPVRGLLAKTKPRWALHAPVQALAAKLPGPARSLIQAGMDVACAGELNQFDAIVAHFGWNGSRLARAMKLGLLKTPVVTIFHGYDVALPLKAGNLGRYRTLFRHGAALSPVSDYFRDLLVQAGADPARTKTARMGVDCEAIPFRPRIKGEVLRIVAVCRMVEKKGTEYALRALAQLRQRRPDIRWQYDIIGDGPLRDSLEELARHLGIIDAVNFLGPLPHETVKARLAEADLFLLPSVTAENGDMEGVPVALMEAMASGLLVVSTRHSGIPELIEHGVSGFLAPERDAEALATCLEEAYDRSEAWPQLAQAARIKVEQAFNNKRLDDELAQLLMSLGEK